MSAPADFGTYRVLHQVGSGVLGPVYRTFDASRDRLIAVKAFKLEILPEDVARLADALRRLAAQPVVHPSVVPVIDAGLEGTTPYLAMDFVTGETLDVTMRHLGAAPVDVALPLIRALADAIDAGWSQGIGHGALHPRDVFVFAGTSDIQVTGHGVVTALERAGLTAPARRPYAAPERIAGKGPGWDQRADVYSLGAIAHELFTGRRPVAGGEQDGTFAASVSPAVRVALRRVLSAALAESPRERFATAHELIAAISAVTLDASAPVALPMPAPSDPAPVPATTSRSEVVAARPAQPVVSPVLPDSSAHDSSREMKRPARQPRTDRVAKPARADVAVAAGPLAEAPLRLPLDPAPAPALTVRTPYPWAAVAAVAVAGLAVGVVAGYQIGVRRLPVTAGAIGAADQFAAVKPSLTDPAAGDTDVPVAPGSAAPPEASPAVEPAAARTAVAERAGPEVRRVRATQGRLNVRSTPAGALVTVDGRLAGETPVTLADVSLGSHVVQIARPGYAPHGERIALTASAPVRDLSVVLQRGLNMVPSPSSAAAGVGTVLVESTPRGARVTIDGKPAGLTPVRVTDLPVGAHVVSITLGGYQPVTARATVATGQTALVQVTLNR